MKKTKFLMPILGMATIATLMPAITSCQNGGSTPTPAPVIRTIGVTLTKTYEVGQKLEKADVKVTYENKEVATTDWILMQNGTKIEEYQFQDDNAVTLTVQYKNKNTNFEVKAEKGIYEKENSYLEEAAYIKATTNATTHDIRFSFKNTWDPSNYLKVTITESDEYTSILEHVTSFDITSRIFGQVFYVPVHYNATYLSKTATTKFNVKIDCVNSANEIVWTDTYKDLYIKFTALNAWSSENYRGYTTDITRMDNGYFSKVLSAEKGIYSGLQTRTMPFPIELRNSPTSGGSNLGAILYDVKVLQNGQPKEGVYFGFQSDMSKSSDWGHWARTDWDETNRRYNYVWDQSEPLDITKDWNLCSQTHYDTLFDINLGFCRDDQSDLTQDDDGVYANFNLIVYDWEDNKISWHEVFEGCRLSYIHPTRD